MWPFVAAGTITYFLVAMAQDMGVKCTSSFLLPASCLHSPSATLPDITTSLLNLLGPYSDLTHAPLQLRLTATTHATRTLRKSRRSRIIREKVWPRIGVVVDCRIGAPYPTYSNIS